MKIQDYYRFKCAIVGRTGSGKTNTAVVQAENMIDENVPIVIIDPQGDWYGIRSDFPVIIFGGDYGDIPLDPGSGKEAAHFVIENRVPVLFDLFLMGQNEMRRFTTDFANELWRKNREAIHIFLDEADMFAPQQSKGATNCLGAWQNVCRRGRSRGLGLTMITQRPAVLNKDLLTQADPVFFHQLTAPNDLRVVDDYMSFQGHDRIVRQRACKKVAKLKKGEAFLLSPSELEKSETVKMPHRRSFDSSVTPEKGKLKNAMTSVAGIDLKQVEKAFADAIEQKKENDPAELKKRIRELEKKLKTGDSEKVEKLRLDLLAKDAVIGDLHKRCDEYDKVITGAMAELNRAFPPAVLIAPNGFDEETKKKIKDEARDYSPFLIEEPSIPVKMEFPQEHQNEMPLPGIPDIGRAERKILEAAYWLKDDPSPSKFKLSVFSGYSLRSSAFPTYLKNLREAGLLHGLQITAEGEREAAKTTQERPTGEQLVNWFADRLGACEAALLRVVYDVEPVGSARISKLSGYSQTSSGFSSALSKLCRLGAIEKNGNLYSVNEAFK